MPKPVRILLALVVNFFFGILPIGFVTYLAWSELNPFRQPGPAIIDRVIEATVMLVLAAFLVYVIWEIIKVVIKIR